MEELFGIINHFLNSTGQKTMHPGIIIILKPIVEPCTPSSIFDKPLIWKKIVNIIPAAMYTVITMDRPETIAANIIYLSTINILLKPIKPSGSR